MMFNIRPLLKAFLDTPYAKIEDDEHIYVRCPFCGDSRKHLDKPHCGIWIKNGQPLIYHCWICDESGVVNTNFLQSMNIYDQAMINSLGIYNHSVMKGYQANVTFAPKLDGRNVLIPSIQDNDNSRKKLSYMQSRLGINFTYRSLEALRIIFSLEDFLSLNNLSINPKYKKARYFINRDYIGFLSTTKDMITFRNIDPKGKFRYIKYSVFENNPLELQSYVLPNNLDVFQDEIDLRLAEGTFDILGVFFHIMDRKLDNQIYAAICGSGYRKVIKYFLDKGFITNMNIHIYSDADKSIEFYDKLISDLRPWVRSFHIYYNGKSKDTGVPKQYIEEYESVII